MMIKRNSGISGETDITRRLAISGIAAGVSSMLVMSPLRGQDLKDQHRASPVVSPNRVVVSTPATLLYMADKTGKKGQQLGTVLACPQSCAAVRPGYYATKTSNLSGIYLNTAEWIREIIYTTDPLTDLNGDTQAKWSQYRRFLGYYRVNNDSNTTGCGHLSRNVIVTRANMPPTPANPPVLEELPLAVPLPEAFFSSLVRNGTQPPNSPFYQAGEIYICPGDWNPAGPDVVAVIKEIGTTKRPIDVTVCPA